MERLLEPEAMDTAEEAEAYDAMDHLAVNTAFVNRVVALGAKDGHYLDLGTGPAHIPILLAQRLPDIRITAIDLSANMLKIGEKHVQNAGLADRVRLELIDAKNLPYADNSFDGVISNSIAHHIPNFLATLQEVSRVIRANGLILVRDLIRPQTKAAAQALVEQYAANDTPYQKKLFYDSFQAAFTIPEIGAMLTQVDLPGAIVVQSSDRHWSIERPTRQ